MCDRIFAMLVPLSIATAWTQSRARRATTDHHWNLIARHRRAVRRLALALTGVATIMNIAALASLVRALLMERRGKAAGAF